MPMDVELKIPRSIACVFTHVRPVVSCPDPTQLSTVTDEDHVCQTCGAGRGRGPKPFAVLGAKTALRLQALRHDYRASLRSAIRHGFQSLSTSYLTVLPFYESSRVAHCSLVPRPHSRREARAGGARDYAH